MKSIPNIRFKGFEGEWEEKTLGDVVKEYNVSNRTIHHQNLLSLSYGKIVRKNIKENKGLLPASFDTYQIIKKDVIVFRGTDLQNDKKSLRVGISEEEGIITPAYICVECIGDDVKPLFLFFQLHYHDVITKIYYRMGDGLRQTLTYEDLKTLPIYFPKDKEQVKVSAILSSIDTLISKREKEVEKMRNIKRALLEKMFPQQGESVPQIRFGEFKDDWEEKKIGEISEKVTKKNAGRIYTETFTNSAEYGIISQRDFFEHDISNENNIDGYYVVEHNDFVYNPRVSTLAPVGPINRNKLGHNGVMSPLYTVFRSHDIECAYLEWFFKGNSWHTFMKSNGNNGARVDRFSISDSVFWMMPIFVPQNQQEQTKIAKLFQSLDNIISARDRQVTLLKNLKRALLEQMFVNN